MTSIAAGCRGGPCRARASIPIGSGCRKSCCSRPRVQAVGPYFAKFLARWPTVERSRQRLAGRCAADVGRARLLLPRAQSSRLRRHRAARPWRGLSGYRGRPARVAGHRALYGAAIAAIAFGRRMHAGGRQYRARDVALYAVEEPLPKSKPVSRGRWPRRCSALRGPAIAPRR